MRGGSSPSVTTVALGGDTSATDRAADTQAQLAAQNSQQNFQLQLADLQGRNAIAIAGLQATNQNAASTSTASNQLAQLQATIQGRLQELQAQAAAQAALVKQQTDAQRNASIWGAIGGIGSSLINNIWGDSFSGGGFGGFGGGLGIGGTVPFSSGIDFSDWVRSIPVGSNDPYTTQIINYVDPLQAIRDREQSAIVPLATLPDWLSSFSFWGGGGDSPRGEISGGSEIGEDWFTGGLWGAGGYFES